MGASLYLLTLADMPVPNLKEEVERIRAMHARDHGVSYSGAWGSKEPGVYIPQLPVFPSEQAAHDYISDNNDKWDCVTAVKYLALKPESPPAKKEKALREKMAELNGIVHGWDEMRRIVARVKTQKSKTKGCPHCGSSIAVAFIDSTNCPVCRKDFLRTAQDIKKQEVAKMKLAEIQAELLTLPAKAGRHATTHWLVGGWCPS